MKRRIYLMRHAEVAYFDPDGRPLPPREARLTPEGVAQARLAGEMLATVPFDRVITSGLPRTVETAKLVLGPDRTLTIEAWESLQEIRGGRLDEIPDDRLEEAFARAFSGPVAPERRFLGGERFGDFVRRVIHAYQRLVHEPGWTVALLVLHGGTNRAILSYALTGEAVFLGGIEQDAACINILDVGADTVIRAVNITPYDLMHLKHRTTTMERYYQEYRKSRRDA